MSLSENIKELYQEVILDHNKQPRNFGELDNCTNKASGFNQLCGDKIDLYLIIKDNIIQEVKFNGKGCAISKASASIMTTILKGKTTDEARALFEEFHKIVTSPTDEDFDEIELGKLAVFAGVREFPARVKCASLAWHTLINALDNNNNDSNN